MAAVVVVLCGLVIALALYLLARSLRRLSKGQCCEGCRNCPHQSGCTSYRPDEYDKQGGDAP